jgi:hypothetical protein
MVVIVVWLLAGAPLHGAAAGSRIANESGKVCTSWKLSWNQMTAELNRSHFEDSGFASKSFQGLKCTGKIK